MKAKFNVGDRVAIKCGYPEHYHLLFGTVVRAPETSIGTYSVELEGGYIMNEAEPNQVCPTYRCGLREDSLIADVGFPNRIPQRIGDTLVVAALVGSAQ